ncbi:MAG: M14 family metallopeptidase [Sphingomonadales bacterium]
MFSQTVLAQGDITTPREEFGHDIGDDYKLINYTQFETYIHKLAEESPRMKLEAMGKTAEGRTQWMSIITAPKNFERLAEYKEVSKKLALAKDLTDKEARALAKTGKTIVWIDGGLHATEVVGAHQLTQSIYHLVSSNDDEMMRFLEDSIILLAHANPDGMEMVSNWYMRKDNPKERSFADIPRLYQKYVGHDNNRDSYLVAQNETINISRIMYREWYPQMMYNHHQSGPQDIIIFIPPFRDHPNYNYDPLLILGNHSLGLAMHSRLAQEDKPGAGARNYANYSTWFNGNIRTIGYFHNQIGMLTEIKGHPTPMELSFWPDRQLPTNDFAMPHVPGEWHFAQAIDYSVTLNRAVLDYASRNRETILYNRYKMGINSIERGSKDTWTVHPDIVAKVEEAIREEGKDVDYLKQTFRRQGAGVDKKYLRMFKLPENRDPRGYILPKSQKDFPTTVKFLNALIKNGITIHQATADFKVGSKSYEKGSFIVRSDQAFRPHVIDMFEPQDHPDEFLFEGGPPVPPYDSAGYTLAMSMGVEFDRILEGFDGPFEELTGFAKPYSGIVSNSSGASGFLISHEVVDSVIAVNRLQRSDHNIYWLKEEIKANGKTYPIGTIYVEAKTTSSDELTVIADELGLNIDGILGLPPINALKINKANVALWDQYGGSMPSGWMRWMMEQYEFDYNIVFPQELDKGKLEDKFDAIVLASGALHQLGAGQPSRYSVQPQSSEVSRELRSTLGNISRNQTLPQLKAFMENGKSILSIGQSTHIGYELGLPISSHLVDSQGNSYDPDKFFIPGSLINMKIDNTKPIAFGMRDRVAVVFEKTSPVFRLKPDADKMGVTEIAKFDSDDALLSGWAWGVDKLYGGSGVLEAKVGKGKLFMFGPEITFRSQPHGTFQFLFNGIFLSNSQEVRLGDPIS